MHVCVYTTVYITIGYVEELLGETTKVCEEGSTVALLEAPEPLCSEYERPEKIVAVSKHKTRFSKLTTVTLT